MWTPKASIMLKNLKITRKRDTVDKKCHRSRFSQYFLENCNLPIYVSTSLQFFLFLHLLFSSAEFSSSLQIFLQCCVINRFCIKIIVFIFRDWPKMSCVAAVGAIMAYVTCPSVQVAKAIATKAVQNKVAACGNIIPGMISVYEWQG